MDKKTIFLLPLDLKGKRQTRITPKFIREVYDLEKKEILPANLQKKKNNIFTLELNRLIGKISDKNRSQAKQEEIIPTETIKPESIEVTTQEHINTKKPETELAYLDDTELLGKIYSNISQEENAQKFLEKLFSSLGIKAYCFFNYEPHTFIYNPVLSFGISEKAQTNLLFQAHDKFLQNKSAGFIHLFFQPVLINDIFFKKKLSSQEFENFTSIALKFFDKYNLPGLLAIFFEETNNTTVEHLEKLMLEIDNKIEPIIPYLCYLFQAQVNAKLDSTDILRKIIHSIRIQSQNLEDEFFITKVKITNFLTVDDALTKKKNFLILLKNYLLKEEGLINTSCNELILLTKENEVGKIIKYISENTNTEFQFSINSLKYPDNGKNLYLYF